MYEEGLLRRELRAWLESLDIIPKDLKIYIQSLTHRSFAKQINIKSRGNEQLEFLGDSVLSFIISTYLFKNYKSFSEGKLSKTRARLVSSPTLMKIADKISISKYILLSENEESCQGREKESILSDAMEAFLGAVFLDQGIDFIYNWLIERYKEILDEIIKKPTIVDYKSYLQETIQASHSKWVKYRLDASEGPSQLKIFHTSVCIEEVVIGKGSGSTKKKSEQAAAKDALENYCKIKI